MKTSKQINRQRRMQFFFNLLDRAKRNSVGDLLEEYEQITEQEKLLRTISWLTAQVASLLFKGVRDRTGRIIDKCRASVRLTTSWICKVRINAQLELRTSRAMSVAVASSLMVTGIVFSLVYRQSTRTHPPNLAEEYREILSHDNLIAQVVVLEPALRVRSGGQTIRRVKLDSATQIVRFHLRAPERAPEQVAVTNYQITLTRLDDLAELFTIRDPKRLGTDAFEVVLPAHVLQRGDYVIRLIAQPDELIWDYEFQISTP